MLHIYTSDGKTELSLTPKFRILNKIFSNTSEQTNELRLPYTSSLFHTFMQLCQHYISSHEDFVILIDNQKQRYENMLFEKCFDATESEIATRCSMQDLVDLCNLSIALKNQVCMSFGIRCIFHRKMLEYCQRK